MEQGKVNEQIAVAYLLMGLRFSEDVVEQTFLGIRGIEASTTYQKILNRDIVEGEALGAMKERKRSILKMATAKFGRPEPKYRRRINATTDTEKLDQFLLRVLTANS